MCEPVSLTLAATTAASMAFTAYSSYTSSQAAHAQHAHQVHQAEQQAAAQRSYQQKLIEDRERQMQENEARAIKHYNYQNLSEDLRIQQLREILAEDTNQLRVEGLRARGQAGAEQASRGATGQSAELVLQDIRAKEAQQRVRLGQQFEMEVEGADQRRRGFELEREQNIAAIQPFIPEPITVNRPIRPNVSPIQSALMGGLREGLRQGNNIAARSVN